MSFCCSTRVTVTVPEIAAGLLTAQEADALAARFGNIAEGPFMSFNLFQKSLGLLGANPSDPYLAERLFAAFDIDRDGRLSRAEYVASLAIMLRGSEDSRLDFSFKIFDASNCGEVRLEEFRRVLIALRIAHHSFSGYFMETTAEIDELFLRISDGFDFLDISRFKLAARNSVEFLTAIGVHSRDTDRQRIPSNPETPMENSSLQRLMARSPSNLGTRAQQGPQTPVTQGLRPRRAARTILGPKRGLAVHFGHENWNMVLNMMIGLRLAVGRGEMEITRPITIGDFMVKDKFSILPSLTNFLDSHLSRKIESMRFVDYAPYIFRYLRRNGDLTSGQFLRSVGPEQLLGNLLLGNVSSLAQQSSEGKSGSFFYYTADGKFLLKTISRNEKRRLKGMLPDY